MVGRRETVNSELSRNDAQLSDGGDDDNASFDK